MRVSENKSNVITDRVVADSQSNSSLSKSRRQGKITSEEQLKKMFQKVDKLQGNPESRKSTSRRKTAQSPPEPVRRSKRARKEPDRLQVEPERHKSYVTSDVTFTQMVARKR